MQDEIVPKIIVIGLDASRNLLLRERLISIYEQTFFAYPLMFPYICGGMPQAERPGSRAYKSRN
ncbi:MAG TPA: hypothetical protein VFP71_06900, partial [Candidatus Angelobacter sp.]|nr:hypothetical protein [Candidatus Angelobacter sp.]